jgi:uncharacterized membrane protein
LLPPLAGLAIGSFLCAVRSGVSPWRRFLLIGCIAGQVRSLEPQTILIGSVAPALVAWLVWSWVYHRRAGGDFLETLRCDAMSFAPLLLLAPLGPLAKVGAPESVRWLVDPLLLVCVMAFCAIKSWHWTKFSLPDHGHADWNAKAWLWGLFAATAFLFATLGVLQYRSWNVPYADSGINEEILYKTLHGQLLRSDNFNHIFLGEHVMLTELLWVPIYALWPSMEWLTILQTLVVAAGVFPVWGLARRYWGDRPALCFALVYVLQPAMHFTLIETIYNTYRFESVIVGLVLFAVYFVEREHWWLAALFGGLVLLCREDMALIVGSAGVYIAWAKRRRIAGVAVVVLSVVYLLFCLQVVIPYFNTSATHVDTRVFQGLGNSPFEILRTVVMRPGLFFARVFDPDNCMFLSYLLLLLAMLPLGRLSLALVGAPLIGVCMLTGGVQASIYLHYHNAPFAILIATAPLGGARIAAYLAGRFRLSCVRVQAVLLTAALSGAAFATIIGSKTPLSVNFWYPRNGVFHYSALYQQNAHTRVLDRIQASLPMESRVAASIFAATHFTHHRACYWFPTKYQDADFLVVDLKMRWNKGAREELQRYGEQGPPGFEMILEEDGVLVFRRRVQ